MIHQKQKLNFYFFKKQDNDIIYYVFSWENNKVLFLVWDDNKVVIHVGL